MPATSHRPTERVLDILELLASTPEGLTLTEISHTLDAPKSSIMPLVHTMAHRKFIFLNKNTSRYQIGIAAFSVGTSYTSSMTALEFIHQEMKTIVRQTQETSHPSCVLCRQTNAALLYGNGKGNPLPCFPSEGKRALSARLISGNPKNHYGF